MNSIGQRIKILHGVRSAFLLAATMLTAAGPSSALAAPAPTEFKGTDVVTMKAVSVAVSDKKGVVAVFLSASCPCSNSHIRELAELSRTYPQFAFVGIHANADESLEKSKAYFAKVSLPFPVIQDDHAQLADQLKALKTPHAFLILPHGQLAYRGGVSNSHVFENADRKYLREALEDAQNNRPVKTPEGRSLGCAISRDGASQGEN